METTLQLACWLLAFWIAVLGYAVEDGRNGGRFVAGLALGAVLAHLGWALLHLPTVLEQPRALLLPSVGYTILPVPLGLLLTAPWGESRARREAHLAAAFRALPLAFCAARLGCVLAGCCHGTPTTLPWGVAPRSGGPPLHPTALYEMAGLAALYVSVRRAPTRLVTPIVLSGIGALRLALEPLRGAPPLGAPMVSPALPAALWLVAGFAFALGADGCSRVRPVPARHGPLCPESAGRAGRDTG